MLHKALPFHCKAVKEENGVTTFEGYAAVFNNIDRAGDIILPGAFKDTIASFLEDGMILWQHKSFMPIGKPLEAYEDKHGLYLKGEILLEIEDGKNAAALMRAGIVKKQSIGYDVDQYEVLTAKNIGDFAPNATPEEAARAVSYWGLALKALTLYEVSPVSIPCNPLADITSIKSSEGLRFDEHLIAGLAALRGVKARAEEVNALRAKDGRTLSKASRDTLEQILDAINGTSTEISALLKSSPVDEPAAPTAPDQPAPIEDKGGVIDFAAMKARAAARQERIKALRGPQ